MIFTAIGVARHRMGSDGAGVTSLVGGHGCPLSCKYCLNPQCKNAGFKTQKFTVSELYERLCADSLYFEATGGGVTFGGGEPLLQADFIADFIRFVRNQGNNWRFSLETCLAIEEGSVRVLDGLIDEYIVDIKDMNDDIYRAYTGKSSDKMKANLAYLAKTVPDRVRVKIPLIPGYNTAEDTLRSRIAIEEQGITHLERLRYLTDIAKAKP